MKFAFFQPTLNAKGQAVVSQVTEAPLVIDGKTFHFQEMFHATLVLATRKVPEGLEVAQDWTYDFEADTFSAPVVVSDE